MPRVLEETTVQDIDRDHVVRRVADWAARIDALFKQVENWLPPGWTAERKGTVQMHEELMKKYNVPAKNLPVLELSHQGEVRARLEPRGLWIIGANGRVDFFHGSDHYVIVDSAENFEPPNWRIAPLLDRRKLEIFNRQALTKLL